MKWSNKDKFFAVEVYLQTGSPGQAVTELMKKYGLKRNVLSGKMVRRWRDKLRNHGSLGHLKITAGTGTPVGRPRTSRSQRNVTSVNDVVAANPELSVRRITQRVGPVSRESVRRILKFDLGLHPYHVALKHKLNDNDIQSRMAMCTWFVREIERQPAWLNDIWFSDESHFSLTGKVNSKNCVFWGKNPPQFVYEKPLHDERCTAWLAMSSHGVIGPFWIEDDNGQTVNVTTDSYGKVLRKFWAALQRRRQSATAWFQQDGATPHTSGLTMEWLGERFGNRIISRRSHHDWAPHSPDLNPLDFFVWGHIKGQIHTHEHQDLNELKASVVQAVRTIDGDMCKRAIANFSKRVRQCMAVHGKHIEQLM